MFVYMLIVDDTLATLTHICTVLENSQPEEQRMRHGHEFIQPYPDYALPEDLILSIHHSICFWIFIVPSSISCVSGTLPVF
jgi:hypothetical protein